MTYVIDYWKYSEKNIDDLVVLENSLIYDVISDDLPSLIQQLLTALSRHIPNFLAVFLRKSLEILEQKNLEEVTVSDIVLKMCILSKQII